MSFRTKKNLDIYCKSSYVLLVVAACAVASSGKESSAVVKPKINSTSSVGSSNLNRQMSSGLRNSHSTGDLTGGSSRLSSSSRIKSNSTGSLQVNSNFSSSLTGGLPTTKIQHKYGVDAKDFQPVSGIKSGSKYVQFTKENGQTVTYEKTLGNRLKLFFTQDEIGRDKYINSKGNVTKYIYRSTPKWVSGQDIIDAKNKKSEGGSNPTTVINPVYNFANMPKFVANDNKKDLDSQGQTGDGTGSSGQTQPSLIPPAPPLPSTSDKDGGKKFVPRPAITTQAILDAKNKLKPVTTTTGNQTGDEGSVQGTKPGTKNVGTQTDLKGLQNSSGLGNEKSQGEPKTKSIGTQTDSNITGVKNMNEGTSNGEIENGKLKPNTRSVGTQTESNITGERNMNEQAPKDLGTGATQTENEKGKIPPAPPLPSTSTQVQQGGNGTTSQGVGTQGGDGTGKIKPVYKFESMPKFGVKEETGKSSTTPSSTQTIQGVGTQSGDGVGQTQQKPSAPTQGSGTQASDGPAVSTSTRPILREPSSTKKGQTQGTGDQTSDGIDLSGAKNKLKPVTDKGRGQDVENKDKNILVETKDKLKPVPQSTGQQGENNLDSDGKNGGANQGINPVYNFGSMPKFGVKEENGEGSTTQSPSMPNKGQSRGTDSQTQGGDSSSTPKVGQQVTDGTPPQGQGQTGGDGTTTPKAPEVLKRKNKGVSSQTDPEITGMENMNDLTPEELGLSNIIGKDKSKTQQGGNETGQSTTTPSLSVQGEDSSEQTSSVGDPTKSLTPRELLAKIVTDDVLKEAKSKLRPTVTKTGDKNFPHLNPHVNPELLAEGKNKLKPVQQSTGQQGENNLDSNGKNGGANQGINPVYKFSSMPKFGVREEKGESPKTQTSSAPNKGQAQGTDSQTSSTPVPEDEGYIKTESGIIRLDNKGLPYFEDRTGTKINIKFQDNDKVIYFKEENGKTINLRPVIHSGGGETFEPTEGNKTVVSLASDQIYDKGLSDVVSKNNGEVSQIRPTTSSQGNDGEVNPKINPVYKFDSMPKFGVKENEKTLDLQDSQEGKSYLTYLRVNVGADGKILSGKPQQTEEGTKNIFSTVVKVNVGEDGNIIPSTQTTEVSSLKVNFDGKNKLTSIKRPQVGGNNSSSNLPEEDEHGFRKVMAHLVNVTDDIIMGNGLIDRDIQKKVKTSNEKLSNYQGETGYVGATKDILSTKGDENLKPLVSNARGEVIVKTQTGDVVKVTGKESNIYPHNPANDIVRNSNKDGSINS